MWLWSAFVWLLSSCQIGVKRYTLEPFHSFGHVDLAIHWLFEHLSFGFEGHHTPSMATLWVASPTSWYHSLW